MPFAYPPSRVPDPAGAPPLRWGVLGPGAIAATFVRSLARHTRQRVVAVGSRSAQRAAAFGAEHGIEGRHPSYDALVADPAVDVVYVASPTGQHRDHALLAIEAGKHVLVEKSFTTTAAQAAEVAAAARARGVVVLEAMWTRFLPHLDVVTRLVADGALGIVHTVLADHGQLLTAQAAPRLHRADLGGGALLDLGIYPVSFAAAVLGRPGEIAATGSWAPSGVDEQVGAVLRTGSAYAVVSTTLAARTPTTASVSGTRGRLELGGPFYTPVPLRWVAADGSVAIREVDPIRGHEGLCFQAAHLAQLVADGRTDSPVLPVAQTVSIMETMDELRRRLGPPPAETKEH